LPKQVIACHDCDLLQREPALRPGGTARCPRCGATLFQSQPQWLDRALAFTLGALVAFGVANAFPIVGLEFNGELIQTTLIGAALRMNADGMHSIAILVFFTTFLAPLLEMVCVAWLLLPLRAGRIPPSADAVFRLIRWIQPWGMTEVFLLALLVALVKLAAIASVVPGIALWSFGVLMVLLAAAAGALEPRELWARLEAGQ